MRADSIEPQASSAEHDHDADARGGTDRTQRAEEA